MGDMYTNPPQSRNEAILRATIDGTEYTDPPQSRIEDLLIQLKEVIEHGEAKIKIGDVQGATASTSLRTVTLTWSDPSDLELDGVILAKWAGTKVVRKAGSAPADNTDGTVVIDNTTRDAYSETGLVDSDLEYGTTYYYRFFPYTDDGLVTDGSSVSATPEKITIASVPTQSGSLTYDGTEQTATFSGYDTDQMTATGITGTNAGTYTASFTPKSDYMWWDGTETAKTATWTIAKATNTITASPSSISLDTTTLYQDVTLTQTGDGVLSVVSGDADVATVGAIENGVFRATGVDTGSTTITVSATATQNYEAGTLEIACSVVFIITQGVFGVSWDGLSASGGSTKLTRTDDATEFVDPIAYINDGNGSSPFDNIMPWAGMEVVQDPTGGEMVKIPKFWVKITRTTTTDLKIQISPTALSGYQVSPAHQDRGDGQGERDFIYVGRYLTSYDGANYHNSNNRNVNYTTISSNMKTRIEALGAEFAPLDIMTWWTIKLLYIVEFADWDSKTTIGIGTSSYNNQKYLNEALYHTGTSGETRDSNGFSQYRYIKNVFDTYTRLAGMWEKNRREIWLDKQPMRCFTGDYTISETAEKIFTSSTYISGSSAPYNFQIIPNYEWLLIPDGSLNSGYIPSKREWNYTDNAVLINTAGTGSLDNTMFTEGTDNKRLDYTSMFYRIQKLPNNS